MLDRNNTCVLIFNMQNEMVPLLSDSVQVLHNNIWLVDFSSILGIPIVIFKHKKLGEFPERLQNVFGSSKIFIKEFFDCTQEPGFKKYLYNLNVENIVLSGAETHVCLYQSAIGLQQLGKKPYLLVDSVGSRHEKDHKLALHRFNYSNIELISQEMFFFEMIRNSEKEEYHDLAMKFLDGRYL